MNNPIVPQYTVKSTELEDIVSFAKRATPAELDEIAQDQIERDGLVDEVGKQAIGNIQLSYNDYVAKLSHKFTADKYVSAVSKNLDALCTGTTKSQRQAVAGKVYELAQAKFDAEKGYTSIQRFFGKVLQLLQGHGFQAKSASMHELASKISKIDEPVPIKEETVAKAALSSQKAVVPQRQVNDFSDKQFKDFINKTVFKGNDSAAQIRKLAFYNELSPDKRKLFLQELSMRKDWYAQIHNMLGIPAFETKVQGTIIEEFVNDPRLLAKFTQEYEKNPEKLNLQSFNQIYEKFVAAMGSQVK